MEGVVSATGIVIAIEDPRASRDIADLIDERSAHSYALYPPESVHTPPLENLVPPVVTFWTIRKDGALLGCGALRRDTGYGEVKSMFVRPAARGQGRSRGLLRAIIDGARAEAMPRLRLETGHDAVAAQALYRAFGFREIDAFAPYRPDPLSVFMELTL